MFTVYMDELKELQSAGIGCYVGRQYFGCVKYADDMKLLCPIIKGLQQIIEICDRFGDKCSVKYNAKKSIAWWCITNLLTDLSSLMMASIC